MNNRLNPDIHECSLDEYIGTFEAERGNNTLSPKERKIPKEDYVYMGIVIGRAYESPEKALECIRPTVDYMEPKIIFNAKLHTKVTSGLIFTKTEFFYTGEAYTYKHIVENR